MLSKLKLLINKILSYFGYRLFKIQEGFHYVPDIYGKNSQKMWDIRENQQFFNIAEMVIKQKKTSLYYDRLFHLFQGFKNVIDCSNNQEDINIVEVGVYRGGSSYFLAKVSQIFAPGRVIMFSVDTFQGHSEKDLPFGKEGKGHKPQFFGDVSFEEVKNYLSEFPFLKIIKGRVQESTNIFSPFKFNFIHLDVDIYEPTYFTLSFFGERMAPAGIIIVDDYGFITCPGVKKAVDSYCEGKKIIKISLESGQCLLVFT